MATLTSSRCKDLRETNVRLRAWLDGTTADRADRNKTSPANISFLLSELLHAGAGLRSEPIPTRGTDPELDRELDEYRRNVERLRDLLPSIHRQLLTERAKLEAQRSRVQSALAWSHTSLQTL
jgi:hypothetical protein